MTIKPDQMIVPQDYPQLAALVWNGRPQQAIPAEDALALYERNWRFVDQDSLTPEEAALIEHLVATFGNGHLLV